MPIYKIKKHIMKNLLFTFPKHIYVTYHIYRYKQYITNIKILILITITITTIMLVINNNNDDISNNIIITITKKKKQRKLIRLLHILTC